MKIAETYSLSRATLQKHAHSLPNLSETLAQVEGDCVGDILENVRQGRSASRTGMGRGAALAATGLAVCSAALLAGPVALALGTTLAISGGILAARGVCQNLSLSRLERDLLTSAREVAVRSQYTGADGLTHDGRFFEAGAFSNPVEVKTSTGRVVGRSVQIGKMSLESDEYKGIVTLRSGSSVASLKGQLQLPTYPHKAVTVFPEGASGSEVGLTFRADGQVLLGGWDDKLVFEGKTQPFACAHPDGTVYFKDKQQWLVTQAPLPLEELPTWETSEQVPGATHQGLHPDFVAHYGEMPQAVPSWSLVPLTNSRRLEQLDLKLGQAHTLKLLPDGLGWASRNWTFVSPQGHRLEFVGKVTGDGRLVSEDCVQTLEASKVRLRAPFFGGEVVLEHAHHETAVATFQPPGGVAENIRVTVLEEGAYAFENDAGKKTVKAHLPLAWLVNSDSIDADERTLKR